MEDHKSNKRNGHQLTDCYDPVSKTLDIRSDGMYPSNTLSNLCSNGFRLDGVVCSSMEGFLQSLKQQDRDKQRQVCSMKGGNAKKQSTTSWQTDQVVWWRGQAIDRQGKKYQQLLRRAFKALFEQNERFRTALMSTRGITLTHSCGEKDTHETILTEQEFCKILTEMRDSFNKQNNGMGTITKSIKNIKFRHIGTWLLDQFQQPGWFGNLVVSRRSWGAFSIYSHSYRSNGMPKVTYSTRKSAQRAAESMAKKHEVPFAVYKCLFCEGWHVSKIGDHKALSEKSSKEMEDVLASLKTMDRHDGTNLDIKRALDTNIPDIHPAYGGLRGRTLSSSRQLYAWKTLVEAGLKQVIELRADYKSDLYKDLCEKSGVAYFRFPVAINMIEEMAELFPELCEKIDRGNFYIACAMGLHRTDIALCLYWVFYAADKGIAPPRLHGYLKADGRGPEKILRMLNAFYRFKTEKEGQKPIPEDVFKERKEVIIELNRTLQPVSEQANPTDSPQTPSQHGQGTN